MGLWRRLEEMSFQRKLLVLLLVGAVLYGGLITVDNVFGVSNSVGTPVDVKYYRERGSAILNGSVPYRDFSSESPPLIMYLFAIPQAFGGSSAAYQIFFSSFAILTGICFYLLLRRFDDWKAFRAGLLYMLMPYALIEFTFGIQDEAVTTFFFFLPLLFFINHSYVKTAVSAALGFWVKIFNVLLMPIMFFHTPKWSDRRKEVLIVVVISLLVAVPFLLLAGVKFLEFPIYYFLGTPGAETGGRGSISPWHFLDMGGFKLPGLIGLALTIGSLIFAWYWTYKKQMPFWASCALTIFLFILFYPKINFVYFILPMAIFMIYGLDDRAILIRCFVLAIPAFASGAFTEYDPNPLINIPGGWLIGLALSLVTYIILIDIFLRTRGKKAFFEV
ncbi:MAG: hypothetical protein WCK39_07340 [Methanomassiliicoccales archaeon]